MRPSRDPDFKEFESLAWGYRATFVLLDTYRARYGIDTLRGMISRWAPPSENRTEAYIQAVADDTGLDPRQAARHPRPEDDGPPGRLDLARGERRAGRNGRGRARMGAFRRRNVMQIRPNCLSLSKDPSGT